MATAYVSLTGVPGNTASLRAPIIGLQLLTQQEITATLRFIAQMLTLVANSSRAAGRYLDDSSSTIAIGSSSLILLDL
jgi:hypothetical protein